MKLVLDKINFTYDTNPVLRGLSLTTELAGSCFCLIGPNGSGKTTLLHILSRFYRPGRGTVLLDGRSIDNYTLDELSRCMAYIPQQSRLSLPFTVWELLLMGRYPHRSPVSGGNVRPRDLRAVEEIIDETRLEHLAKRSVLELSGGEFQRVLFAKALVQDPQIYLVDEPFSQMDVYYQLLSLHILQKRIQQGRSVIAVLHDLPLVDHYADQVLLLANGRITAFGSAPEVMTPGTLSAVFNVPFERLSGGQLVMKHRAAGFE